MEKEKTWSNCRKLGSTTNPCPNRDNPNFMYARSDKFIRNAMAEFDPDDILLKVDEVCASCKEFVPIMK